MKKIVNIIFFILTITILGCDDIFEEDISEEEIITIFPRENDTIIGNAVIFNWENLEGAEQYRVQIFEEGFTQIVIDSTVTNDFLSIPISSGDYYWQVRGENFAYQSSYSVPKEFRIESTEDLSLQELFLESPSNNFYTNNNTVIVSWSSLESASSYSIQIEKIVGTSSSIAFQQSEITELNFTLDSSILNDDAQYVWKVKAINDESETSFSSRVLFLDTVAPNQPILTSPNNASTLSSSIDFEWTQGTDTGEVQSPISSVLEIASDDSFNSIVQSFSVESQVVNATITANGTYYWRVKCIDRAGNESLYSETRELIVE